MSLLLSCCLLNWQLDTNKTPSAHKLMRGINRELNRRQWCGMERPQKTGLDIVFLHLIRRRRAHVHRQSRTCARVHHLFFFSTGPREFSEDLRHLCLSLCLWRFSPSFSPSPTHSDIPALLPRAHSPHSRAGVSRSACRLPGDPHHFPSAPSALRFREVTALLAGTPSGPAQRSLGARRRVQRRLEDDRCSRASTASPRPVGEGNQQSRDGTVFRGMLLLEFWHPCASRFASAGHLGKR